MSTGDASPFVRQRPPVPRRRRVAIKDNIDVAGEVTTSGNAHLAAQASPAPTDAACLGGVRAEEARGEICLVGKTVLNELAAGVTGDNPWTGLPRNPLYPGHLPGGSSSGSAVAVASDLADVALGTDSGGSVRIPAAFTGTWALKATTASIDPSGIRPLSPTLDSVGVHAADLDRLALGWRMLRAVSRPAERMPPARSVGRVVTAWEDEHTASAIDGALAASGLPVESCGIDEWAVARGVGLEILAAEAFEINRELWVAGVLGAEAAGLVAAGAQLARAGLDSAYRFRARWRARLLEVLERCDVICCAVVGGPVPTVDQRDAEVWLPTLNTMQVNLAGLPALCLPLPAGDRRNGGHEGNRAAVPPVSLQLIGAPGGEERLLDLAARIMMRLS